MKIIECVPNFSEGKDDETFKAIKESVEQIDGCKLLNIEPDADYNRVVVTIVGNEKNILEGALAMSKAAAKKINMMNHKGKHPRIGAIDVVPFIPVKNATMEDCIKISEKYAEIISEELDVPVYLYENSAKNPARKNLSNIRKGEYEGLEEKLKDPNWKPDFGPSKFNAKLGAIVTGARPFLIAYNVNIKTEDIYYAKEISEILRESGRAKRDSSGKVIKNENGEIIREPGKLKCVKGMGVSLEKYRLTQVSMNLTDYHVTPIHVAFEEVKKEAEKLGTQVYGSEIIGLIPLEALLMAGKYYSEGRYNDENSLLDIAIERLGLNQFNGFVKEEKIIDYMI
jgi:glutamate formiminotransferase/formiminotetrahydrofolate cyclodeaminase